MSKVLESAQGNIAEKNTVGEDDVRSAVRKRKKSTPDHQVKSKYSRNVTNLFCFCWVI